MQKLVYSILTIALNFIQYFQKFTKLFAGLTNFLQDIDFTSKITNHPHTIPYEILESEYQVLQPSR